MKNETPKTSKTIKKDKKSKKPIPSSAEYVIDSDIEADSGAENANSRGKSTITRSETTSISNGVKRKAVDEPESSTLKKTKVAPSSKDKNDSQLDLAKKALKNEPHLNGKSVHGLQNSKEIAPDSSGLNADASRSPSPSPNDSEESSESVAEIPTKEQTSTNTESKFTLDLSDSSNAETEVDTDDETEAPTSVEPLNIDQEEDEVVVVPSSQKESTEIPPYRPSEGFSRASINNEDTGEVRNLLSPDYLRGKQLWHITVPASVPISSIRSITRPEMFKGGTILTHKGSDYGFSVEGECVTASRVLIPGPKGSKYQPLSKQIDLSLHLRQIVELPNIPDKSGQAEERINSVIGARKSTPKQPAGLKMRYRPFGDVDDGENAREATRQAKQRMDNAQIPVLSEPSSPPAKKSKQSKKSKHSSKPDHAPSEWVDPQMYSAPIVVGNNSQHAIELPSAALDNSQLGQEDEGETLEGKAKRKAEKAARKEERRLRKQAKAAAKEAQEDVDS